MTRLLIAVSIFLLAACSDVPDNTLPQRGDSGSQPGNTQLPDGTLDAPSTEDDARYEKLVREARGAFLPDERTIEGVELSAELYDQATRIRADEYDVLWEAARTCVWLGNYGPEDKQKDYVIQGITYANTAVEINPEGVEGLFYDGALAGKLAELDISYGANGMKTIMDRMQQLIDMDSNFIYGGPHRVLGILYMRAPGDPIGPGDWDLAEKHLKESLEYDPNWPENQLYYAELEFGLADERDQPELADSARARLKKHFMNDDVRAPMGSKFEFKGWKEDARQLLDDNE